MRRWLARRLRAVIGDDGTSAMWDRLTPEGRQAIRLALVEARELGHPCIADEHVLLGVLRHGASRAATLLRASGLDLTAARADLLRVGPTLGPAADPADALRSIGVDVEQNGVALRRSSARTRWQRPNGACAAGHAGGAGIPDPTRCASTFWPNARSRSPPNSRFAAAIPGSDPTTCSTGLSRTPSTHLAPNSAAAAVKNWPLSALLLGGPTRCGFSSKHAASNSPYLLPSSAGRRDIHQRQFRSGRTRRVRSCTRPSRPRSCNRRSNRQDLSRRCPAASG